MRKQHTIEPLQEYSNPCSASSCMKKKVERANFYVASASSSGKRSLLVFLDEFIVSSDFLNGLDNIIGVGMKNLSTLLHGVMKTPSKKQEKLIDGNPLRRVRGEEKEKKAVEKLENCSINGLTEDDQLITEHFMAGLCLMGQLVQIKLHYLTENRVEESETLSPLPASFSPIHFG
ncbi:unnamed protein product [Musa textilis]